MRHLLPGATALIGSAIVVRYGIYKRRRVAPRENARANGHSECYRAFADLSPSEFNFANREEGDCKTMSSFPQLTRAKRP